MFEEWVPWVSLIGAFLVYGLMTLALSVLQPQGLTAMLGLASTDLSENSPQGSSGDYRATRIVVTTIRSGSFIAIVASAIESAYTVVSADTAIVWLVVATLVLVGVIGLRTLLNRMASTCYEDVRLWLAPIIWVARQIGILMRLNRVADYMRDFDSSADPVVEPVENVLNVLQNLSARDLRAGDFMTPISDTVSVQSDTQLCDLSDMMGTLRLRRIVVYGRTVDEVLGTIEEADVLRGLQTEVDGNSQICGDWISGEVFSVPITQHALTLFDDFRDRMTQTAVMLDEDGKVAGTLTFRVFMERLLSDSFLPNGEEAGSE